MKKLCHQCRALTKFRRLNRVSFLERSVLPRFGVFPWECALCRRKVLLPLDGRRMAVGMDGGMGRDR